uniref:Threonylcarbamoyl-AMP synthase C-terminal domain-containing protein n=2 Tax=Chrysotila carterae TaxID=13221 RepID=A0A7S4EZE3_CHRCT
MSDLGLHDILILEASEAGCCDVGIESTVVKLDEQSQQLVLLRRGGIPESVLASWMQDHGGPFELVIKAPSSSGSSASKAAAVTTAAPAVSAPTASPSPSAHEEEIAQEAPGMLLTHYAPDVPSYLLRFAAAPAVVCEAAVAGAGEAPCELKHAAVLDFGGRAKELAAVAMAYRDLSDVADAAAAATRVFEFLRWAEEKQALGARYVLLPDVLGGDAASSSRCNDEHLPALADRLYRAASGRSARLVENGFFVADAE